MDNRLNSAMLKVDEKLSPYYAYIDMMKEMQTRFHSKVTDTKRYIQAKGRYDEK